MNYDEKKKKFNAGNLLWRFGVLARMGGNWFFRVKKPLQNARTIGGRVYTDADLLAIETLNRARGVSGKENIVPRKVNGRLVGFYVLNEGGETAIIRL